MKTEVHSGISGTFRQGGKEYDGATLFRLSARVRMAVFCPDCSGRMDFAAADVAVCNATGCRLEGILYNVGWPFVTLEAVQDEPAGVEAKVTRASESVARDIEGEEAAGTWTPRPRGELGALREDPQ